MCEKMLKHEFYCAFHALFPSKQVQMVRPTKPRKVLQSLEFYKSNISIIQNSKGVSF